MSDVSGNAVSVEFDAKGENVFEKNISYVARVFLGDKLHESYKMTVGKVLTIIDAITEDVVRRKAIHDLVKQAIWDGYHNSIYYFDNFYEDLREILKETAPEGYRDKITEGIKRPNIFK